MVIYLILRYYNIGVGDDSPTPSFYIVHFNKMKGGYKDMVSDINSMDIVEYLELLNEEFSLLDEAEYNRQVEKLHLEILDVDKYIKVNEFKEITNPVTFVKEGVPSSDGLLSNEIFGITKEDRAGIFAYIDLHGVFMDPSCYKVWCSADSRIKEIVHETDKFIINDDGDFVKDPHGKNGIKFLKDNFDKIKIKTTDSRKRDLKIKYLEVNKKRMFITKYIVIPAYYRDMNNSGKNVGVGAINKLYASVIISSKSLITAQDYGFSDNGAIVGRLQETLVTIYDWFVGNTNSAIKDKGTGLSKKYGLIRRANMSKTTDNSARLVLSAPSDKVETIDDFMVDLEHAAIPLAAILATYKDFIVFHVKRFFEEEFRDISSYTVIDKDGTERQIIPKDPLIEFSDERIIHEMTNFIYSYSDRFVPIKIPVSEEDNPKNKTYYMKFKGYNSNDPNLKSESIVKRKLTWLDIFYMAAVEATKERTVLITRFPIDSYLNQFPIKVTVSSTKETEHMYTGYFGSEFYKFYPKIRNDQIGTDTSKLFADTLMISNLYLNGIGGDYDGDTATVKALYTEEAVEETKEFITSKFNFVNLGCSNIRIVHKDSLQAMYCMTKVLSDTKLIDPEF